MQRNTVWMIMVANGVEYFQNTIYGIMLMVLGPLFFPSHDPYVTTLASAGAFAAGTLAHPLGAAIVGYRGDTKGRKNAMIFCMVLVTIPSFVIAILPTYESIGWGAPAILLLARIVQGVSVGGESQSSAVYVYEQVQEGRENAACSLLASSSFVGILLASSICSLMNTAAMPTWGWRVPFLVGGLLGIMAYGLRRLLPDGVPPEQLSQKGKIPLFSILKMDPLNFLRAMVIYGAALLPYYMISIYLVITKLPEIYGLSSGEAMGVSTGLMVVWVLGIPFWGRVADRITGTRMLLGAGGALIAGLIPVFHIFYGGHFMAMLFALGLYTFAGTAFVSAMSVFVNRMYPSHGRCSGVDMSTALASLLFGAPAIAIALFLVQETGLTLAPAFYVMGVTTLALWAIMTSRHFERDKVVSHLVGEGGGALGYTGGA